MLYAAQHSLIIFVPGKMKYKIIFSKVFSSIQNTSQKNIVQSSFYTFKNPHTFYSPTSMKFLFSKFTFIYFYNFTRASNFWTLRTMKQCQFTLLALYIWFAHMGAPWALVRPGCTLRLQAAGPHSPHRGAHFLPRQVKEKAERENGEYEQGPSILCACTIN